MKNLFFFLSILFLFSFCHCEQGKILSFSPKTKRKENRRLLAQKNKKGNPKKAYRMNSRAFPPGFFRKEMARLVIRLSKEARKQKSSFILITQNGNSLLSYDYPPRRPRIRYLKAIHGVGQESLFFGHSGMDKPTPKAEQKELLAYLRFAKRFGKWILVTDYCKDKKK
ncbi:MAG: hypothetical protein D6785_07470, partial [Planctomycetota bacterium]